MKDEAAQQASRAEFAAKMESRMASNMTIREAFALAAMQGLCANHVFFEGVGEAFEALGFARGSQENATAMRKMIAKCSLAHADALIEALKETP